MRMKFIQKALAFALGVSAVVSVFDTTEAYTKEGSVFDRYQNVIAPTWDDNIRQWSEEIQEMSVRYRMDPDLIASVIFSESNGFPSGVSYAGAVGLMGIMPQGPGFEFRPNADSLLDPKTNINWGTAILADIMRQSGGDLHAALAAYNGGWLYAGFPVPREYAKQVLHNYGRAIASRNGLDPDMATQWSVAIEARRGYISAEPLLIGGNPIPTFVEPIGEHVAYSGFDSNNRTYYVKAYAIPLELATDYFSPSTQN